MSIGDAVPGDLDPQYASQLLATTPIILRWHANGEGMRGVAAVVEQAKPPHASRKEIHPGKLIVRAYPPNERPREVKLSVEQRYYHWHLIGPREQEYIVRVPTEHEKESIVRAIIKSTRVITPEERPARPGKEKKPPRVKAVIVLPQPPPSKKTPPLVGKHQIKAVTERKPQSVSPADAKILKALEARRWVATMAELMADTGYPSPSIRGCFSRVRTHGIDIRKNQKGEYQSV